MNKIVLGLGLFFAVGIVNTKAQEVFKLNNSGGGFNVTFGYQGYNDKNLFDANELYNCGTGYQVRNPTDRLVATTSRSTFVQPSKGVITSGFQGYGLFKSFLIGGETNFFYGSSAAGTQVDSSHSAGIKITSGTTSRFAGGDVLLDVGFIALRKRGFVLYPMIGVGYSASGLWLSSQSNVRTYPELAKTITATDNNLQNIWIWSRNAVLDFGLGAQYMLGASTEDKAKGFSLGLRFGYKMQLKTDNILVNANKSAKDSFSPGQNVSLPQIGYSGPYIKLLIGYGKIGESR